MNRFLSIWTPLAIILCGVGIGGWSYDTGYKHGQLEHDNMETEATSIDPAEFTALPHVGNTPFPELIYALAVIKQHGTRDVQGAAYENQDTLLDFILEELHLGNTATAEYLGALAQPFYVPDDMDVADVVKQFEYAKDHAYFYESAWSVDKIVGTTYPKLPACVVDLQFAIDCYLEELENVAMDVGVGIIVDPGPSPFTPAPFTRVASPEVIPTPEPGPNVFK